MRTHPKEHLGEHCHREEGDASLDGLLAVRGVVDVVESVDDEETMARAFAAALASLERALDELLAMRAREGEALHAVLSQRLESIARLAQAADDAPGRKPEAVRARLAQSVAALRRRPPRSRG